MIDVWELAHGEQKRNNFIQKSFIAISFEKKNEYNLKVIFFISFK